MKFLFCTDIHLDHTDTRVERAFCESIASHNADGIFITGDISVATLIKHHLRTLAAAVACPIYFALGNHDFWHGSFDGVRAAVQAECGPKLRYMTFESFVELTPSTALVGTDGFYDAFHGSWQESDMGLWDWDTIHDFAPINNSKASIVGLSRKNADWCVQRLSASIDAAVAAHDHIVVLTHVPPFSEAHKHRGQHGDRYALPWYTSKLCGDMLVEKATAHPSKQFAVFCGHTHGGCTYKRGNITVHVGAAAYGSPKAQVVELT